MQEKPGRPCLQPPLPAGWKIPLHGLSTGNEHPAGTRGYSDQKEPANGTEQCQFRALSWDGWTKGTASIIEGCHSWECPRECCHQTKQPQTPKPPAQTVSSIFPCPFSKYRNFLHRMLRNINIVIHEKRGTHQMLYVHLCLLRQLWYRYILDICEDLYQGFISLDSAAYILKTVF